jgi:hypothetical protein
MVKNLKKYGKKISYEIQENGAWFMVKDGGLKYLHLTSKAENADRDDLKNIYKKSSEN